MAIWGARAGRWYSRTSADSPSPYPLPRGARKRTTRRVVPTPRLTQARLHQNAQAKACGCIQFVSRLQDLHFGFVSDFDIRILNLVVCVTLASVGERFRLQTTHRGYEPPSARREVRTRCAEVATQSGRSRRRRSRARSARSLRRNRRGV